MCSLRGFVLGAAGGARPSEKAAEDARTQGGVHDGSDNSMCTGGALIRSPKKRLTTKNATPEREATTKRCRFTPAAAAACQRSPATGSARRWVHLIVEAPRVPHAEQPRPVPVQHSFVARERDAARGRGSERPRPNPNEERPGPAADGEAVSVGIGGWLHIRLPQVNWEGTHLNPLSLATSTSVLTSPSLRRQASASRPRPCQTTRALRNHQRRSTRSPKRAPGLSPEEELLPRLHHVQRCRDPGRKHPRHAPRRYVRSQDGPGHVLWKASFGEPRTGVSDGTRAF